MSRIVTHLGSDGTGSPGMGVSLVSTCFLIVPRALPAPAFEHVDDGARLGVDHRSNQLQFFTTGAASLVRRFAFQNGDFLTEE